MLFWMKQESPCLKDSGSGHSHTCWRFGMFGNEEMIRLQKWKIYRIKSNSETKFHKTDTSKTIEQL